MNNLFLRTYRSNTFRILLVLGLCVVGYLVFKEVVLETQNNSLEIVSVQKGSLIQEVKISGKVKPSETVDLSFEKSGKIDEVLVFVGNMVSPGQRLLSLESDDLRAQLEQARASINGANSLYSQYEAAVRIQEAKLEELTKGTRSEDIKVKETELEKSQQDLVNQYDALANILSDAHARSDDALWKYTADQFTNDGSSPRLIFRSNNAQAVINVESQRTSVISKLVECHASVGSLTKPYNADQLDAATTMNRICLLDIRSFLQTLSEVINDASALSATTVDAYKNNVSIARSSINTAITALDTQTQLIASQMITIKKISDELSLKRAGATTEQLNAQKAAVEQARATVLSQKANIEQAIASVKNIEAQLSKTIITAPFAGVVTRQDAKKGEIVGAAKPLLSVMSLANFEIEANIPELDIAKITIGDKGSATLDAYGQGVLFGVQVTAVDPAETIVEGVSTYKTHLYFIDEDPRIKSGMTANISIEADRLDGVLIIPRRAVISTSNGYAVQKAPKDMDASDITSEKLELIPITLGITGSDGNVEVLEGLVEGDQIMLNPLP